MVFMTHVYDGRIQATVINPDPARFRVAYLAPSFEQEAGERGTDVCFAFLAPSSTYYTSDLS